HDKGRIAERAKRPHHDRHRPQQQSFTIVRRPQEKPGLWKRLWQAVRGIFSRKQQEVQISERTRRIVEEETRSAKLARRKRRHLQPHRQRSGRRKPRR
ncbi:MAG: hypothetical protein N2Z22_09880, partial [Turneriella sp.]|nr:hypothetical protein [Turneriella sp.]